MQMISSSNIKQVSRFECKLVIFEIGDEMGVFDALDVKLTNERSESGNSSCPHGFMSANVEVNELKKIQTSIVEQYFEKPMRQ